jgi:general secretion pathway protein G
MIVISIIVILALIVLPQYKETVRTTKEAVLRDDLHQMRKMIDQFTADKARRPRSLQELVSEGYLDKIPEDPMTERADWYEVPDDSPDLSNGGGIKSVCSSSGDTALDKSQYNDCDHW